MPGTDEAPRWIVPVRRPESDASSSSALARLASACAARGREDLACLGQAAATSAALDEPLARCGLEQAEMLAGARLPDPDRPRGRRDAAAPSDLDEQAHPRRVPELPEDTR